MKKIHSRNSGRESETAILGNDREREFPLTPEEGLWICAKGKCAENPRSFINNHLLKKHQDCHEEIKCEKCDKKFTAKRNFRRHIKTVHKDNLEERNVTVSVNIAHIDPEDVAVGDLVVVPLDPSPLDPLTND